MSLEDVDACRCGPAAWSLDVLLCCYLNYLCLSLDDTFYVYVGETRFQTFYDVFGFKLRGTPPLNF